MRGRDRCEAERFRGRRHPVRLRGLRRGIGALVVHDRKVTGEPDHRGARPSPASGWAVPIWPSKRSTVRKRRSPRPSAYRSSAAAPAKASRCSLQRCRSSSRSSGLLVRRTRFGLQLTASGEHPRAARAVGIRPDRVRLIALLLGGVLCALGRRRTLARQPADLQHRHDRRTRIHGLRRGDLRRGKSARRHGRGRCSSQPSTISAFAHNSCSGRTHPAN